MEAKRFTETQKKLKFKDTIYYISEQIGKGSFSNVFNIVCSSKDNKENYEARCMKIFKTSERYSNTAKKEIEFLSMLSKYKHFIHLQGHFVYEEHYCLIFKKYNINLLNYYKLQPINATNLRFIISEMLHGLCVLREFKIIHRDLKPENILVKLIDNAITECVICDFNSSVDLRHDDIEPYNKHIVTCWYRAPEIYLDNITYSYEIDMWSFGLILYELIARKPLFHIKFVKHDCYENEKLFNQHYSLLGQSPLFYFKPMERTPVHVDSSLFKSGYQTLFTETIKWDPAKRFTPKMALDYLKTNMPTGEIVTEQPL